MKYLIKFLIIFYSIQSNATTLNDRVKENNSGDRIISTETKHNIPLPAIYIKKNDSSNDSGSSNSAVAAWANYAESPVSNEYYFHNIQTGGFFYAYFKNDFSKDAIWVTIESYTCIDNKNCEYNKENHDLSYYSYIQEYGQKYYATREMKEKGTFENEVVIILTSGDTVIKSTATNTVNIY